MRFLTAALVAAAALGLAGCSAAPAPTASESPAAAATAGADADAVAFLARHDLADLSVRQIVETLDASEEDRTQGPIGSVRPSELVLSDEQGEITLTIPDNAFYLAFAPYREQTHDCFNHNLATCAGELAEEELQVKVVDDAGATLVDEQVTTHANGFAGIWLPRDITGTLTVTHNGDTVTMPIATGSEDPTCLTTLQLGK